MLINKKWSKYRVTDKKATLLPDTDGGANVHPHLTHFLGPTKQHLNRFSRVCTAHGRRSLCFTMGRLYLVYIVPWAHPSPQPKQHLERFSKFCSKSWQTDWQTMLLVQVSVAISHIYVCSTAMRPKNCFHLNIPNKKVEPIICNHITAACRRQWEQNLPDKSLYWAVLEAAEAATTVASRDGESAERWPPPTESLACNFLVAMSHSGELNTRLRNSLY